MNAQTAAGTCRLLVPLLPLLLSACSGEAEKPTADAQTIRVDAAAVSETDATPTPAPLAAGLRIRDISAYQSVQVRLVTDGVAVDATPQLVQGKPGMIGVLVDVENGWVTRPLVGELTIELPSSQVVRSTTTRAIERSSDDNPQATGFAFVVDGAHFVPGARFSVSITELDHTTVHVGDTDGARWPALEGAREPLQVRAVGPLNLVLVPFVYNADGSGRIPPIDEDTLDRYREAFNKMYPIAQTHLTVRAPVQYDAAIGTRTEFRLWLDTLTHIRHTDNAPHNSFYYGIAAPADTMSEHCADGCIGGIGWVPDDATDAYHRAAVGLAFSDRPLELVALHEIGHVMGRRHAPCGDPANVDPGYPYVDGRLGVFGYDATENELVPRTWSDVMGYCFSEAWISDYTYEGILRRLVAANQPPSALEQTPQQYRIGLVDEQGSVTWRRTALLRARASGDRIQFAQLGPTGSLLGHVTGYFTPLDHLEGGMLMVPVTPGPAPATIVSKRTGAIRW